MRNSLLLILGKRVVPKDIVVKSGIILVSERQPRQTVRKSPFGWGIRFGIMLFKKSHYKAKLSKNTGIEKVSYPPRTKKNKWSDRKSTRLNSSHVSISYGVFCLKKKITRDR